MVRKEEIWVCKYCGREFVSYSYYNLHQINEHLNISGISDGSVVKCDVNEKKGEEIWTCPHCNECLTTYFYYKDHQLNVHPNMPPILNAYEELKIEEHRRVNKENMKRIFDDVYTCLRCKKKGDRWRILDHECSYW